MKRILLYGILGVYNYGCEAIVRGTVDNLKKAFPKASITYASINVEEDKKRLKGCDVEIIERPVKGAIKRRIIRKLVSYIGIDYKVYYDSFKIIDDYDIIVSIGGDMYTLSAKGVYPYSLMKLGDIAIKKGKKYIIWGASIGPFDSYPKILKKIQKHLRNVSLIISREHETINYLKSIGIHENVIFLPDPAFYVATANEKLITETRTKKNTIGINLSPLSTFYFTDDLQKMIAQQVDTILKIIRTFNCDIVLLPHVISEDINDDDYRYLLKIKDMVSRIYPQNIRIVEDDPGFIGIKEELKKCDIVIAARMHCAVNAVATKIPAIFLSYSRKSFGMANLIYKNNDYVVGLETFSDANSIIDKIKEISKLEISNFQSNVDQLKKIEQIDKVKEYI
ncbi:polysaccharide pyruvyl transferase family protein [Aquimarina longa]|uniref:polysaccharide pyruvyl transferase family protein n=1 Tax=Aquimarina longa TaxID=1080221 RepID=UPI000B0897D8|nr:polysaccharide pyruvyl transferase family protein [Aquimarina longa]